jgi:hypothetical protein
VRSVGLMGEPLGINQGLGQWLNLQRAVRPSSGEARWWTGSPCRCDRSAWILSLANLHNVTSTRSRAGVHWGFTIQIMHVSSFGRRRVNHRLVEQAPGNGRLCPGPLARATGSRSTRSEVASDAEQWPGRTCRPRLLDGDGPASQARRYGCPGASVHTKNCMKHRKAGNHQAHNTPRCHASKDGKKTMKETAKETV